MTTTYRFRFDEPTYNLLRGIYVEACFGIKHNDASIKRAKSENLFHKLDQEINRVEAVIDLDKEESNLLNKAIQSVLCELDEWELQVRLGAGIQTIQDLQKSISSKAFSHQRLDKLIQDAKPAALLLENWIMCQECQNTWQEQKKYRLTRCTTCQTIQLNPIASKDS